MKKTYSAWALMLACASALTGCGADTESSSAADIRITSGSYRMEIPEDSDALSVPCLIIDDTDGSMQLNSDYLSSYACIGTYETADGHLTAVTDDGKYTYVFEIVDENTLRFLQEKSSEIITIDAQSSVPAYDGALFRKMEELG